MPIFSKTLVLSLSLFTVFLTSNLQAVEVGDQAPQFSLPLLKKTSAIAKPEPNPPKSLYKTLNLSDYLGSMVYVDFWASYCVPCRESFPMLSELRNRFGRDTFEVLAISNDYNPKDALRFINAYETTFPVLSDPTSLLAKRYGVEALPMGFLIDQKGTVLMVHEGFQRQDIHDILAPVLEFSARQSD